MKQRGKAVVVILICLTLLAGVGFTRVGSKYRTQEEVNLIFANVTSNSAKQAGEKFKELVEEYSGGKMTVDLFQDNQWEMIRRWRRACRMEILILQRLQPVPYQHCIKIIICMTHHICF